MTTEEIERYGEKVEQALRDKTPTELAMGYLRYEAMRKINLVQFKYLHQQNLLGENFDRMIDVLTIQP